MPEGIYKVIANKLLPVTCKQQSKSLKRLASLLCGKACIGLENPQSKILQLCQSSLKVLVVRDNACLAHVGCDLANSERFGCYRDRAAGAAYNEPQRFRATSSGLPNAYSTVKSNPVVEQTISQGTS